MKANKDLMSLARHQLKGMWWLGVGVTLIIFVISCVLNLIPKVGGIIDFIITGPLMIGGRHVLPNGCEEAECPSFGPNLRLIQLLRSRLCGLSAYDHLHYSVGAFVNHPRHHRRPFICNDLLHPCRKS